MTTTLLRSDARQAIRLGTTKVSIFVSDVLRLTVSQLLAKMEPKDPFSEFSEILVELRAKEQLCDGVLRAEDGTRYPVHRAILSAASPYFRALFTSNLGNPSGARELEVPQVSTDILATIIDYAYTGKVKVTSDNVEGLLPAADHFQISGIMQQCCQFLQTELRPDNCIGIHKFSKLYYCPELATAARRYTLSNFRDVAGHSPEFLELGGEELTDILSDDELNCKREELVFETILRWVDRIVPITAVWQKCWFMVYWLICSVLLLDSWNLSWKIGKKWIFYPLSLLLLLSLLSGAAVGTKNSTIAEAEAESSCLTADTTEESVTRSQKNIAPQKTDEIPVGFQPQLDREQVEKLRTKQSLSDSIVPIGIHRFGGVQSRRKLSEMEVRKIVYEAIATYDGGTFALEDYALESNGGKILRFSERMQLILFGIRLWWYGNSPIDAIQADVRTGQCWAFKGSEGYLVIQLMGWVQPSAFSLEHIPVSANPDGNIASAPKEFSVYGLLEEKDSDGALLGRFSYDINGDSRQYFIVPDPNLGPFPIVELRIHSNHGNLEYTCLYRFGVHGNLVKPPEVP